MALGHDPLREYANTKTYNPSARGSETGRSGVGGGAVGGRRTSSYRLLPAYRRAPSVAKGESAVTARETALSFDLALLSACSDSLANPTRATPTTAGAEHFLLTG